MIRFNPCIHFISSIHCFNLPSASSPISANLDFPILAKHGFNMKKNTKIILIMGMLTAIGPFSIDMYLPAFPDIARSLHTEISEVTLSLSSFFIGVAAGQLLYGPLLERFGRKKPLYGGLSLYLLASAGCASAQSVDMLILLRFFQAMGGCVGMVAVRAITQSV